MKQDYYQSADPQIELKDVLNSKFLQFNFYASNAVKYLFRYLKKDNPIGDLQKAITYLRFAKEQSKIFISILRFLTFWVITKKIKTETIVTLFGLNEFQAKTFELILAQKYDLAIVEFNAEIKRLQEIN